MRNILFFISFFGAIYSSPLRLVQNIAENSQFQDIDNYLPKMNDLPKYEYSTFLGRRGKEEVVFGQHQEKSTTTEVPFENSTIFVEEIFPPYPPNISVSANSSAIANANYTTTNIDPINDIEHNTTFTNRTSRQGGRNSTRPGSQLGTQLEAQEEEDDEEGGNMITGLISTLLGSLSRPDGSIDVDAITGLLGSLSTQNPDGTYDFMGLIDLLRGFFGGEGGIDLGTLIGGLTGALLQGLADPPGGAKGIGKFVGRLTANIVPSLSAPPPNEEGEPQPGLDPFGLISGFLKTFLSGSSASVAPANTTDGGGGNKSKFSILKAIVSTITSIFSSSSGASSSCMPTMLCQNQDW